MTGSRSTVDSDDSIYSSHRFQQWNRIVEFPDIEKYILSMNGVAFWKTRRRGECPFTDIARRWQLAFIPYALKYPLCTRIVYPRLNHLFVINCKPGMQVTKFDLTVAYGP